MAQARLAARRPALAKHAQHLLHLTPLKTERGTPRSALLRAQQHPERPEPRRRSTRTLPTSRVVPETTRHDHGARSTGTPREPGAADVRDEPGAQHPGTAVGRRERDPRGVPQPLPHTAAASSRLISLSGCVSTWKTVDSEPLGVFCCKETETTVGTDRIFSLI